MRNFLRNLLPSFCSSSSTVELTADPQSPPVPAISIQEDTSDLTSPSFNKDKYNLSGKVALITGSSSATGAAIATQLAQYGADVVLTGRNTQLLDEVAENILSLTGRDAFLQVGDLTDEAFVVNLVAETIAKFGHLDLLVNAASTSTMGGDLESGNFLEAFDTLFELNVRAVVQLIQVAMPELIKAKGSIVNVSSFASGRPVEGIPMVYSMTKAALDMVTKCVALELGPSGVRVNSVNPGILPTSAAFTTFNPEEHLYMELEEEELDGSKMSTGNNLLLGHNGPDADDVANLVSFLASNDAKNITGSILIVDGGRLLK